ncbi:hypothetical protein BE221DRAFT_64590, partial [Ostreococcus tauri]
FPIIRKIEQNGHQLVAAISRKLRERNLHRRTGNFSSFPTVCDTSRSDATSRIMGNFLKTFATEVSRILAISSSASVRIRPSRPMYVPGNS